MNIASMQRIPVFIRYSTLDVNRLCGHLSDAQQESEEYGELFHGKDGLFAILRGCQKQGLQELNLLRFRPFVGSLNGEVADTAVLLTI